MFLIPFLVVFKIADKSCFFFNLSAKYRPLPLDCVEEAEMLDTMVTMVEMSDTMVTAQPRRKVGIQSAVVSSITGLLTLT